MKSRGINQDQFKLGKLASQVALALSLVSLPAIAAENSNEQDDESAQKIVITGSRILSIGAASPSPVTVVGEDLIKASGAVNINELLNKLPSMVPGLGASTSNTNGTPGISTQNLRGQGEKRTLTLINGRRHVGSVPGTSTVDMGTIPTALIDRIEVLTGGASSIYGADAVAGVINIITKKDFAGMQVNIFGGISSRSDGENSGANITYGFDFDDGKGNNVTHFSYDTSDEILARDRPYTNGDWRFVNAPGTDPEDPNRLRIPIQSRSLASSTTTVAMFDGVGYTFNADGSIRPIRLGEGGIINPDEATDIISARTGPGGEQFAIYNYNRLRVPTERFTLNNTFNYDFGGTQLFVDAKYTQSKSQSRWDPKATYNGYIYRNNPFIQDDLAALMDDNGLGYFSYSRVFDEMGDSGSDYDRDLFQLVAAVNGEFDFGWDWEVYAQMGKATSDFTIKDYYQGRWDAALDVAIHPDTNEVVCRASLPDIDPSSLSYNRDGVSLDGCVPHNVFVPMPQELIDYVKVDHTGETEQTQNVFHFSTRGDLVDNWAGTIAMSAGLEYRKERSETTPSQIDALGIGSSYATSQPVVGTYSVKEAFAEFNIPLLSDTFMAEQFDLNLSARLADYTEAGSSTSWNVGLVWKPIEDVTVRVSNSEATRAPNINEQFAPKGSSGAWLYQPCSESNYPTLSAQGQANCETLGVEFERDDQGNIVKSLLTWYQWGDLISEGNQNLDVEVAETLTAGIVYTPSFIEGFSFTADYWEIDVTGLISNLSERTIMYECIEAASLDNQFCDLITRQDNGVITSVEVATLNLNKMITEGIDFEFDYRFDLGEGKIRLNSMWQKLLSRKVQSDPSLPLVETSGNLALPEWRGTFNVTYSTDNYSAMIANRYVGGQKLYPTTTQNLSVNETAPIWYTDMSFSYRVNDELSFNVGANNVFDKGTPQLPLAFIGGGSYYIGTTGGLFDTSGRMYYASMTYQF
ncbi:TonB-dependent receptor domain-containing protein [Aliikangiella maris]|uniref:TonB-dependent receptor n=2 Tax=Aliikangiella maris TaxID=3162458 RepID=A0ABV3MSP5_9GAMM